MLAKQLKRLMSKENLEGSVVILVHGSFKNCILRSSVDDVVNFMKYCSIMMCKPYGSEQLLVYGFDNV